MHWTWKEEKWMNEWILLSRWTLYYVAAWLGQLMWTAAPLKRLRGKEYIKVTFVALETSCWRSKGRDFFEPHTLSVDLTAIVIHFFSIWLFFIFFPPLMGSSLMSRLNGRLLFSFYSSALSVADVDSGFVENFTIRRLKKKNKKCILSCPSRQVWAEGRPTKAKTLYRFCFPSAKLDVNRLVFALVWFTTRCNRSNYIRVMRVSREGAV